MANIGTLAAKAVLTADGFHSGTERVIKDARNAEAQAGKSLSGIQSMLQGVFQGIGQAAVNKLPGIIQEIAVHAFHVVERQRQLTQEFGLTRQQAAGLVQLSRELGLETGSVQENIAKANQKLGELRSSLREGGTGGSAGAAARAMGIDPAALTRMSAPEALATVGDRMRNIANDSDRAAAMAALFGESWRSLLPLLERGSAGLQAATNRARPVSAEDEALVRQARAQWNDVTATVSGLWDRFATRMTAGFGAMSLALSGNAETLGEAAARRSREAQARARPFESDDALRRRIRERVEVARHWGGDAERVLAELSGRERDVGRALFPEVGRIRTAENRMLEDAALAPPPATPQRDTRPPAASRPPDTQPPAASRPPDTQPPAASRPPDTQPPAASSTTRMAEETAAAGTLAAVLERVRRARVQAFGTAESHQQLDAQIQQRIRALQEETAVIGMTADQAERYRLSLRGATQEQLQDVEAWQRLAQINRDWQQAQDRADELRSANRSPLTQARDSIIEMIGARQMFPDRFRAEDFTRNIGAIVQQLAGQGLSPAPLLGGLDASGADTAAILQERSSPQVDRLTEILAALRARAEAERESQSISHDIAGRLDEIYEILRGTE